ncbi:hypothetical protein [Pseudoalteromonas rubra]|uniref:Uncharacterized protein n=1 Tax=Pseudoalteromonas rubra TaxID=43658 RepID=A0A0U2Y3A7_9GAMM|nr:hypothetical protein [Pseudoalteromonas rubra]ALU44690.1 hypothetical protein AT705_18125 [Pseudoalteromonas rubra]
MKELQFFTEKVLGSPGEGLFSEAFKEYQSYIDSNKSKLPDTVVNIVKSDWYFNARDPRCPKDAWLINQRIENEFSTTERQKKPAEYEITLLGAYHDCHLHFVYKSVVEIDAPGNAGSLLEKDYDPWRIDEFSRSDDGYLVHKIYFLSGKVWTIKCQSFEFGVTNL